MIGVDDQCFDIFRILIGQICCSCIWFVFVCGLVSESEGGVVQELVEVLVGGVVIFVFGVEDFVKVQRVNESVEREVLSFFFCIFFVC